MLNTTSFNKFFRMLIFIAVLQLPVFCSGVALEGRPLPKRQDPQDPQVPNEPLKDWPKSVTCGDVKLDLTYTAQILKDAKYNGSMLDVFDGQAGHAQTWQTERVFVHDKKRYHIFIVFADWDQHLLYRGRSVYSVTDMNGRPLLNGRELLNSAVRLSTSSRMTLIMQICDQ